MSGLDLEFLWEATTAHPINCLDYYCRAHGRSGKVLLEVQVAVTLAEKVLSPPKQDVKVLDVSQV